MNIHACIYKENIEVLKFLFLSFLLYRFSPVEIYGRLYSKLRFLLVARCYFKIAKGFLASSIYFNM